MTFINVVVHTCEDLNYRVYMQHEFTLLGINELLEELEEPSQDFPALHKQIKAYQDNHFNVAALVSCNILQRSVQWTPLVLNCMSFIERGSKVV